MDIKRLIQGEKKIVKFIITDKSTELPLPLTGCTFTLKMKLETGSKTIDKHDGSGSDFDKTDAALGIIKVTLDETDLDTLGKFNCQLKTLFPNTEIDKTIIFYIYVDQSIVS
jgi:hypothetical protein